MQTQEETSQVGRNCRCFDTNAQFNLWRGRAIYQAIWNQCREPCEMCSRLPFERHWFRWIVLLIGLSFHMTQLINKPYKKATMQKSNQLSDSKTTAYVWWMWTVIPSNMFEKHPQNSQLRCCYSHILFTSHICCIPSNNSTCWCMRTWSSWVKYSRPGGHPGIEPGLAIHTGWFMTGWGNGGFCIQPQRQKHLDVSQALIGQFVKLPRIEFFCNVILLQKCCLL